jgi:hypothetical protein
MNNRPSKKTSKIERNQIKKEYIEYHQKGEGLYLFKNRSNVASLELPKHSSDGKKWVEPNETWEGDNYFFKMIPKEAILIKTISEPKKETVMENKLILDQPDQITTKGKVEHVVPESELTLNENPIVEVQEETKEKLLTEDPLAGVTILKD